MSTATIDRFLGDIARILREHNGAQLKDYMVIEPPFRGEYEHIVAELNQAYPVFNQSPLEKKVNSFVPDYEEGDEGGSNASFIAFIVKYFTFIRDVDPTRLVETHDMLKSLLKSVCSRHLCQERGLAERLAVNVRLPSAHPMDSSFSLPSSSYLRDWLDSPLTLTRGPI